MSNGKIVRFSDDFASDGDEPIRARFISGSMSFDQDYMRKHMGVIWVSIKPTDNANLTITVHSDKRASYVEKTVESKLANFYTTDFSDFSFETNRAPRVERLKIKVKKFTFLNLVLEANYDETEDGQKPAMSDATVLGVDFRVRTTGYVK